MLILIPVDGIDPKHAKVTTLPNRKKWALVDFDEGVIQAVDFYDNRAEAGVEWIDFVVLANAFENYMEFMEEGMIVLCVREEETIEEIIEAFKFKELDEVGF